MNINLKNREIAGQNDPSLSVRTCTGFRTSSQLHIIQNCYYHFMIAFEA